MDRRTFLHTTAATAAAAALTPLAAAEAPRFKFSGLRRGLIVGRPTEAVLRPLKEAGIDGVQVTAIVAPELAAKDRAVAENLGLSIHSVMRGWAEFNSPKPELVKSTWETTAASMRAAQGYGADNILLVPCRIGGMKMPQPWEFQVRFEPGTGHLLQVVDGDNTPYKEYMEAHDHAWDTSQEQVGKLIDVARETGVVIALEDVWNNLWVDPKHFAAFIDSFHSPWVKAWLDLGNMVKYSPTQEWVRVLGPRIASTHVKGFKLNANGHDGRFCDPLDGSIDWHEVRRALDEVDYHGWLTVEGSDNLPAAERRRQLDVIIAG
jgi:hexulose-6-phosphate isomerase